jgi:predicted DNA binding CopG/RHH family protein
MEEKFETEKGRKILSFLFFATFLILIFSFLFLFITEKSLEKKKKEYQERMEAVKTKEIKELEQKIELIKAQLRDAEKIAKEKYFTQKFFDFLEKNKVTGIKISSAEFDFEKKQAKISAEGPDYLSVSRQLKVFESLPEIENFSVSEVSLEKEGKVKVNFSFSFKEDLIK